MGVSFFLEGGGISKQKSCKAALNLLYWVLYLTVFFVFFFFFFTGVG